MILPLCDPVMLLVMGEAHLLQSPSPLLNPPSVSPPLDLRDQVGLLVMDEIHLLGADRGPTLEVIVSRMRYVAAQHDRTVRFVGLSTALANANDLAEWLGVPKKARGWWCGSGVWVLGVWWFVGVPK